MKITIFKKLDPNGCQIKPLFEIDYVECYRYEPINHTIQVNMGNEKEDIGKIILNVEKVSLYVDVSNNSL